MEAARARDSDAAALVARIVAGDRQAEAELVERFSRGVRCLLGRTVGDPAAIEDLHQDLFRIALERIRRGELREPEKLAGFMCGLARNLAIEHFRGRRRTDQHEEFASAGEVPSGEASPLDALLAGENAGIVRAVLREMPNERDRQILQRFYMAEESKESICRGLGLTSLHFNRVLCRARDRYRELYEKRRT